MSSGTCPDCMGKGWIEMKCLKEGEARVCPACHGSGLAPSGLTPLEKECPSCHGTGQIDIRTVEQQKCVKCNGTGRYPPPRPCDVSLVAHRFNRQRPRPPRGGGPPAARPTAGLDLA
jgi:DnaJ-class molecular chaperone